MAKTKNVMEESDLNEKYNMESERSSSRINLRKNPIPAFLCHGWRHDEHGDH